MFAELKHNLNYVWRILATGVCFVIFGIGGLFISIILFPAIKLFVKNKQLRQLIAQKIVHYSFRFHIGFMRFLGVMTTEIIGLDRLNLAKTQLFVANHPTLIDVVLMLSLIPRGICIVKQALFKNIFLGGVVKSAGYVSNSAHPKQLITDCVNSLEQGSSLVIFPEGTRTIPGEDIKFHRGPARVAIEGNWDITPVTINCDPSTLTKDKKWYQIPSRRFHVRIEIGETLSLKTLINNNDLPSLSVRKLNQFLENYFQEELNRYERA